MTMQSQGTKSSVLTVSQLTEAIKQQLESKFPAFWLQGEVSNCKLHGSGHLYFSLKDSHAQIPAVMYRTNAMQLTMLPKDGDQVVVYGGINIYPPSGRYQILVQQLRLAGIGELLLKLEELKQKLSKRGWFNAEHKKPLPKFPKKIGVVTSPTGAAIQDMLNILTRRFSGFHLILNPVKVQGEGSAQEIAQAIRQFNEHKLVDVIIVGRGGGSIEDLWAFNEEVVAQAIFESHIPIISAVGHETDYCLSDFVADVRAPTPSAAAEMVIAEKAQQLKHLSQMQNHFYNIVKHLIKKDRHRLVGIIRHPIFMTPYGLLGMRMQKVDDLKEKLDSCIHFTLHKKKMDIQSYSRQIHALKPTSIIRHYRQKFAVIEKSLKQSVLRLQSTKKEQLSKIETQLKLMDPRNLLSKGYTIVLSEKGRFVITSAKDLKQKDNLSLLFADGKAAVTVQEIYTNEQK